MVGKFFSLERTRAILIKEFIQLRRDRLTFAMMVGIPIMQLLLFGFAINSDPRHLPTALVLGDSGPAARSIAAALENSTYFEITGRSETVTEARRMLDRGRVSFVVTIPPDFERMLSRGEHPQLLVEADASDPSASSNAVAALPEIVRQALADELKGPRAMPSPSVNPVDVIVHRHYNPEGITQYNIVPGLLGVVLTMSMIMMTALSLTRETERGTMENLLAMPVRPLEVMVGKVAPYIAIGLVQVVIILAAAGIVFGVPLAGSMLTLGLGILLFIAAMLLLGYTFSTMARSQMQAMQMTLFFFLPSLLLSGFMFPYRGMPQWAQALGEIIPLTHFLRIIRGVVLKGNGLADTAPNLLAITAFFILMAVIALARYRRTLD